MHHHCVTLAPLKAESLFVASQDAANPKKMQGIRGDGRQRYVDVEKTPRTLLHERLREPDAITHWCYVPRCMEQGERDTHTQTQRQRSTQGHIREGARGDGSRQNRLFVQEGFYAHHNISMIGQHYAG